MQFIVFVIVCGLLGEALEVSRLRWAGIAMPALGLRVTLFVAYGAMAAVAYGVAGLLATRRMKGAAALFAVALLVPWANFELLPAAGSATSIAGSFAIGLGAAVLGWAVAAFPKVSPVVILAFAIGAHFPAPTSRRVDVGEGGAVATGKPNILLILVDTLRADHLGAYGYDRPTSPRIDELARQGVRFERTVAQAAWTKPSVASLFTGSFVHRHGVVRSLDALSDDLPTLAESLQRAGYRTAAFSANPWITPEFRFSRGFEEFESGRPMGPQLTNLYRSVRRGESLLKRVGLRLPISGWVFHWAGRENSGNAERDEAQAAAVVDWLSNENDSRPFFLYVHMIGPHDPYDPPAKFAAAFARSSAKAPRLPPPRVQTVFEEAQPLDAETLERLVDQYDAAIAHADSLVGEIIDALSENEQAGDTIVILTADHGEEFYEHRNWRHGNQLYEEVVHVPLVIRNPAAEGGKVRRDPAMLIDIFPTVLAMVGVDAPVGLQGRPLFPEPDSTDQPVFTEHWWFEGGTYVAQAVSREGLKLQDTRDEGRGREVEELYDLRQDAGEQVDLIGENRQSQEELAGLRTLLAQFGGGAVSGGGESLDEIDPATRERLCRLGYFSEQECK